MFSIFANKNSNMEKAKRIVFVGSGNLATQLATAFMVAGHRIVQVYSRTLENAETLARKVHATATDRLETVTSDADVYFVSVTDRVLEEVVSKLCHIPHHGIVVHTAGSMPMSLFAGKICRYGVFYPMQTFSKNRPVDFTEIPVFLEASDEDVLNELQRLAETVTKQIYHLSSERRRHLHLAAVWACNFTNHCYHVAEKVLDRQGIPFQVMLPLIDETARKVHQLSPAEAQTGPAIRYDLNVLSRLSAMMEQQPEQQQLFDLLSQDIHRMMVTEE